MKSKRKKITSPVIRVSESDLQTSIVDAIGTLLKRTVLYTFFPAGEVGGGRRAIIRGSRLKRMGLQPGWPDLQFVYKGKYHGMEIKTIKGRVSKTQDDMHKKLEKQGACVAVVRSIDEAIKTLNDWKLLARTATVASGNRASDDRRKRQGKGR